VGRELRKPSTLMVLEFHPCLSFFLSFGQCQIDTLKPTPLGWRDFQFRRRTYAKEYGIK